MRQRLAARQRRKARQQRLTSRFTHSVLIWRRAAWPDACWTESMSWITAVLWIWLQNTKAVSLGCNFQLKEYCYAHGEHRRKRSRSRRRRLSGRLVAVERRHRQVH